MARWASRVVIVDDHALFAEALVMVLRLDGFTAHRLVPKDTDTLASLRREVAVMSADIALLDLDLGLGSAASGMSMVAGLTALGVKVVVVSGHLAGARAGEAMSLGAQRVISKSAPLEEIVQVVRRLSSGLPVISRQESQVLQAEWREQERAQHSLQARLDLLTTRESEILGQLMTGTQVREIARALFVSEATVRTHVKAVLAKLQVNSQLSAVGLAHRAGWRAPEVPRIEPRGREVKSTVVVDEATA